MGRNQQQQRNFRLDARRLEADRLLLGDRTARCFQGENGRFTKKRYSAIVHRIWRDPGCGADGCRCGEGYPA